MKIPKISNLDPSGEQMTISHNDSYPSEIKSPEQTNSPEIKENKLPTMDSEKDIYINKNMAVDGNIYARNYFQLSDIRLKTNIEDLVDAILIINSLSGKKYEWREGTVFNQQTGGQKVIGLIAQQVREVLPELVHEDKDGLLTVSYADLVPVIISAFNEQTQELRVFREEVRQELSDLQNLLKSQQSFGKDTNQEIQKQLDSLKQNIEKLKEKQLPLIIVRQPRTEKYLLYCIFPKMLKYMICFGIFLLIAFLIVGIIYFSEKYTN
jgi:hypothetical protein